MLAAGPGQPPIIARAAWARGTQLPRVAPAYGEVKMAFVHHTENPNGYSAADVPSMLRAIYAFHRDVNGWNDIGYNFVVDRFGRVFEARAGGVDEPVVGAHAGGYNLVSTGIAVLGSFSGTPISAPARRTLQRLLAWKLALHGVATQGRVQVRVNPAGAVYSKYPARARVSLPRIAGHRDADSTDCPGNSLYGELPGVRRAVASLPGRTVIAALALVAPPEVAQPAPAGGEPPPPGAPPTVPAAGSAPELLTTLTLLDGTPVTGAQVVLEARRRPLPAPRELRRRRGQAAVGAGPLPRRHSRRRGRLADGAGRSARSGSHPACRELAQRLSSAAWVPVRPRLGSVCTSSVGASRAAAQSWQAPSSASSIQASGRPAAYCSIASSFQ